MADQGGRIRLTWVKSLPPNSFLLASEGSTEAKGEATPSIPNVPAPGDGEAPPDINPGPTIVHVPRMLIKWFR